MKSTTQPHPFKNASAALDGVTKALNLRLKPALKGIEAKVTPDIGKPYVSSTAGRAFLSPEGLAIIKVSGADFRPLSQISPV